MTAGLIGEVGRSLTEDDLRRVNTRRGLLQLIKSKNIDLEDVRKTLLYEQELRQLQVELVRLQRWVQADGQRIAILVEGRDAAGKGGTIRRFTEHLNPRAMRVVALPNPTDDERGQWYFQRYIRHLPNKGEIVFFDRSWYNRAVVEPVEQADRPRARHHGEYGKGAYPQPAQEAQVPLPCRSRRLGRGARFGLKHNEP